MINPDLAEEIESEEVIRIQLHFPEEKIRELYDSSIEKLANEYFERGDVQEGGLWREERRIPTQFFKISILGSEYIGFKFPEFFQEVFIGRSASKSDGRKELHFFEIVDIGKFDLGEPFYQDRAIVEVNYSSEGNNDRFYKDVYPKYEKSRSLKIQLSSLEHQILEQKTIIKEFSFLYENNKFHQAIQNMYKNVDEFKVQVATLANKLLEQEKAIQELENSLLNIRHAYNQREFQKEIKEIEQILDIKPETEDKLVWLGDIEPGIDAKSFDEVKKLYPQDEFETDEDYLQRLIQERVIDKWFGKQTVSMRYNANIEQFRVSIDNKLGRLLNFDIKVPRGVAQGFKENVKTFSIYCEEQEGKLIAVRAEVKYNGEVYSADLDNIWIEQEKIAQQIEKWSDEFNLELPKGWVKLAKLKKIEANNKGITYIPQEIWYLGNLQVLNLRSNKIKEIPESIGNLSNLQELHLWQNQIKEIPESIGNLSNLKELSLYENQIKEIPESIGNLSNLQVLGLRTNIIKEIPENIGNLSNLKELSLYENQIKEIPESIGNLSNLQKLHLNKNKIKKVPETFEKLYILKELYLDNNSLSSSEQEKIKKLLPNTSINF